MIALEVRKEVGHNRMIEVKMMLAVYRERKAEACQVSRG